MWTSLYHYVISCQILQNEVKAVTDTKYILLINYCACWTNEENCCINLHREGLKNLNLTIQTSLRAGYGMRGKGINSHAYAPYIQLNRECTLKERNQPWNRPTHIFHSLWEKANKKICLSSRRNGYSYLWYKVYGDGILILWRDS
jgi:hypothetical protein